MEQRYIKDNNGNTILPITSVTAVRDNEGQTLAAKIEELELKSDGNNNLIKTEESRAKNAESSLHSSVVSTNNALNTERSERTAAEAQLRAELNAKQYEAEAIELDAVPTKDSTKMVNSGAVYTALQDMTYDVSVKHPASGVDGGNTYTLSGALAVLDANLSASEKKGGMSIKFIQSSDNKYVQFRLMANTFTINTTKWQRCGFIHRAIGYNLQGKGLEIELGDNNLVTVTLFKKNIEQNIWYESGCKTVVYPDNTDIVLTFTRVNNVLYYVYYVISTNTLTYSTDYKSIPDDAILLEAFWTWSNAGYITFTIEQNNHIGFDSETFGRLSSMMATPAQLKKISELESDVDTLSIHKAIGYNTSGIGLEIELGDNNLVTVTLFNKNGQFIWYESGHKNVVYPDTTDIVLTFTRENNVRYYIYYVISTNALAYTSNYSTIPADAILLESFWTWGSTGYIAFTVEQNNHIGFDTEAFGRLSCVKATPNQLKKIAKLENDVKGIHALFPYSGKIFLQVGCIGDSYTSGYQYSSGVPKGSHPEYSWPYYISKITGNNWVNFAKSGSSTKSWVTESDPTFTNMDAVRALKCQAYIIGLGLNDQSSTMPTRVDLGTISDIGTDADSYYAYYYKLIQNLLTINPKAIVFCNTGPNVSNSYNQAVRDIVNYCKNNNQQVWLCDLAGNYMNEQYYLNPIFLSDRKDFHYTAVGYEFMAECFIRVVSDVINANVASFQEVEEIPFDIVSKSGNTASRPIGSHIEVGYMYMDTQLGKPIYASQISGDTVTWIDATGTVV